VLPIQQQTPNQRLNSLCAVNPELSASIPRSGLLAPDNFRLARHSRVIHHAYVSQKATGTDGDNVLINDNNLNPHLPLRTDLSRAETFLLALFLVDLIRSASIGSPRVETAINHASNPNSRPLAGLISPNT